MRKTLITGVLVTAVAALPLVARADWNDLKQRGQNLEQQGQKLEQRGQELKTRGEAAEKSGKTGYDKGKVVEQKTVTTYKKGRNYATTTTHKVHKE